MNSELKTAEETKKHDLMYYINHPVYGLAYDSIVSILTNISIAENIEFPDEQYTQIFTEAEDYVNKVMASKTPELEIVRTLPNIRKKYPKQVTGLTTVYPKEYHIGSIIQLLFLIALCDLMPKKSDRVMKALTEQRTYIESHNYLLRSETEIWKLVAQRIPPKPECPRAEDLMVTISRQEDRIKQLEEELARAQQQPPSESVEVDDVVEEDTDYNNHYQPRVGYLLQLLNIKSESDIKNKRALCRVAKSITGASRSSTMAYLKSFSSKYTHHKEFIDSLNKELEDLGLPLLQTELSIDQ